MDVGEAIRELESRGVRFYVDGLGVGFEYDWRSLEPADPLMIGELVLEREEETADFLRRRCSFGVYASIFRSATYRIRTSGAMLPWLRERCPSLYLDLTVRLPDRVQELWEQGASVEEFTRAIRGLEEARSCALNFYLECRKGDDGQP